MTPDKLEEQIKKQQEKLASLIQKKQQLEASQIVLTTEHPGMAELAVQLNSVAEQNGTTAERVIVALMHGLLGPAYSLRKARGPQTKPRAARAPRAKTTRSKPGRKPRKQLAAP